MEGLISLIVFVFLIWVFASGLTRISRPGNNTKTLQKNNKIQWDLGTEHKFGGYMYVDEIGRVVFNATDAHDIRQIHQQLLQENYQYKTSFERWMFVRKQDIVCQQEQHRNRVKEAAAAEIAKAEAQRAEIARQTEQQERERKQQERERKQQERERKQHESMLAGLAAEKDALQTLSLIHTIEDRSTWAANWKKGTENWDKPYAMDFYFPDRRTAVDIKFKSLNQRYQSFALDKDHYDKYQVYIDTYPDVNKGILWYIERTTRREYLLEMDHMKNCIERGMIQLRAGHKDYIRKGSSGQYYAIPLDCFKDITDEEWSVTGIKKRDNSAANPFTKL